MPFKFSQTSMERLSTCHIDIQVVMLEAIGTSRVDFGISQGYRSSEEQFEIYQQGRTKPGEIVTHIDGVNRKSKHNFNPSHAVDIFAWVNGQTNYDDVHMGYLAGHILNIADRLYTSGTIRHQFRSGLDWNMNGVFVIDQRLKDGPHYEIV